MFDEIALKLLISELVGAPIIETPVGPKLQSHGLPYLRVHIQVDHQFINFDQIDEFQISKGFLISFPSLCKLTQGNLEGSLETGFSVRDSTGNIPILPPDASEAVKLPSTIPAVNNASPPPTPVIIIGKVFEEESTSQRTIQAEKLIFLRADSKLAEQWLLEVQELALKVYPRMAKELEAQINGVSAPP